MRLYMSCLIVVCGLAFAGCGDTQQPQAPTTPSQPTSQQLTTVVISVKSPGRSVGSFPAQRQWTVCGKPTEAAPAWPNTQACRQLQKKPQLLEKLNIETRDLRSIERYEVAIKSNLGTLSFPTSGSGTRATRWNDIKRELYPDAWNQAVSTLPEPADSGNTIPRGPQ